jgi:hypothetical protein
MRVRARCPILARSDAHCIGVVFPMREVCIGTPKARTAGAREEFPVVTRARIASKIRSVLRCRLVFTAR